MYKINIHIWPCAHCAEPDNREVAQTLNKDEVDCIQAGIMTQISGCCPGKGSENVLMKG